MSACINVIKIEFSRIIMSRFIICLYVLTFLPSSVFSISVSLSRDEELPVQFRKIWYKLRPVISAHSDKPIAGRSGS